MGIKWNLIFYFSFLQYLVWAFRQWPVVFSWVSLLWVTLLIFPLFWLNLLGFILICTQFFYFPAFPGISSLSLQMRLPYGDCLLFTSLIYMQGFIHPEILMTLLLTSQVCFSLVLFSTIFSYSESSLEMFLLLLNISEIEIITSYIKSHSHLPTFVIFCQCFLNLSVIFN